jgi:hypothetical protein
MRSSAFDMGIALRAAASVSRSRLRDSVSRQRGPKDIFLCIADHFEPQHGQPATSIARARLEEWLRFYPEITRRHRGADGRSPKHSFFYPYDEYDEWEFCHLSELCASGHGEIELHLHHKDDTEATLTGKLRDAVRLYRKQGAFSVWPDGKPAFAFIHGDWALDNSRCEDGHNYCGVNNELTVLAQQGCYADFTFPAWQHTAQPRQLNSIYYAIDDPERPKSYDRGRPVRAGTPGEGTLLMVQGPLVPFLRGTRRGPRLAMDDGDLASSRRYSPDRLDRWVRAGVHVQGRPDRVFIKLFTHGAADKNRGLLLGQDLDALFTDAEARYNDGCNYRLHYVTAREMFNIIKATEAGIEQDISTERDWILPRPASAAVAAGSSAEKPENPVAVGAAA